MTMASRALWASQEKVFFTFQIISLMGWTLAMQCWNRNGFFFSLIPTLVVLVRHMEFWYSILNMHLILCLIQNFCKEVMEETQLPLHHNRTHTHIDPMYIPFKTCIFPCLHMKTCLFMSPFLKYIIRSPDSNTSIFIIKCKWELSLNW